MHDLLTFARDNWMSLALVAVGAVLMFWDKLPALKLPAFSSTTKPDRKAAVDALMVAHDFCEGCTEGQAAIQAAIAHVLKHHPAEGHA